MRQIIDWEKIQNVAADDVNFVFHWKYDGSYDQGDFVKLMKYKDNKLAEVIGYMTDRPKTEDELLSIAKEEARQAEVLFTAYANIDFCNLTALINENYTDGFDDIIFMLSNINIIRTFYINTVIIKTISIIFIN